MDDMATTRLTLQSGILDRRHLFRTVAAAAVAAAISPAQAFSGAAGEAAPDQRKMMMFAAPPLAVAAAVFSIASSLKTLFGSRDSNRAIKQRLDQIIAQNQHIIQMLGEIVVILNNLGVIVRESVRLELIFDKQTALIGESRQLFDVWSAELVDGLARRQAEQRYRNDILPDVRDLANQLMDSGYGFTPADTIGMAMMMEFWMSRRLGERRSFRRQTGETYVRYFDRALDPLGEGTPAKALAYATAQRDRMKAILDAADTRIGPNGWEVETFRGRRERVNGRTTYYTEYRILQTATGNQQTGYRAAAREQVLRQWTERDGECIRCFVGAAPPPGVTDPPDNTGPTPTGRVAYWNSVRETHSAAVAEVELFTRVNDTLRFYREQAEEARSNG